MHASQLSKISADAHVDEPHDLWFERIDPRLRDRAPRRIQAEQEGGWSLVVDDDPVGWLNLSADEAPRQGGGEGGGRRARRPARDDAHRRRQRRDHLPHHRSLRVEHRRSGGRTRVVPRLQRLGARAARGHRADQARGDDPHVGGRHGDRGSATRGAERLGRRLAPAPRGNAGVEPPLVGTAVGGDPRDRDPCGDAPGNRPRHDLLPGLGIGDREPARDAVDGAARGRAVELRRRAGTLPRAARGHGRGQRRMDGVGDVDPRRVLPRAPGHRLDEADPRRTAESLPSPPGARDLPGRPDRPSQRPVHGQRLPPLGQRLSAPREHLSELEQGPRRSPRRRRRRRCPRRSCSTTPGASSGSRRACESRWRRRRRCLPPRLSPASVTPVSSRPLDRHLLGGVCGLPAAPDRGDGKAGEERQAVDVAEARCRGGRAESRGRLRSEPVAAPAPRAGGHTRPGRRGWPRTRPTSRLDEVGTPRRCRGRRARRRRRG